MRCQLLREEDEGWLYPSPSFFNKRPWYQSIQCEREQLDLRLDVDFSWNLMERVGNPRLCKPVRLYNQLRLHSY